jgi:predicted NUDIX family NTP pyrophosphohydrolase
VKPRKTSAGLLAYRWRQACLQVLLVHPGGPFWKNKDHGAWTIPKGELDVDEEPFVTACREFLEETGFEPAPPYLPLGTIRQKSGKEVRAWGFEGDFDVTKLVSNVIPIEWPPRSGRRVEIPEVDRGEYFGVEEAVLRVNPAQIPLISALQRQLEKKSE